jgi:hypothetical protein
MPRAMSAAVPRAAGRCAGAGREPFRRQHQVAIGGGSANAKSVSGPPETVSLADGACGTAGSSGHADRRHRAGRHAGAAARAGRGVDFRQRRPARRGLKRIATRVAMVAADPAFHSALWQAGVGHPRLDRPRPGLSIPRWQRAILAGGGAGAAESAFAALEIHFRVAAHDDDDPRRANRDAVAAARAGARNSSSPATMAGAAAGWRP